MPSSVTHRYIGLDTLKRLNKEPKNIIEKRINNYIAYCQFTDPLYFYHILIHKNKIIALGHLTHRKYVFKTFNYLIEANKKNKDLELFTLIAGFITHYQADKTCHPYINYLADDKRDNIRTDKHFEIETYLDSYYLNKNEHVNTKTFNNANILFKYKKEPIVIDTLNKMFKEVYNMDNIGNKYYRSLFQMHLAFRFARCDRTGIKKLLYKLIDLNTFKIRRTKYLSYHFNVDNDNYYLNFDHRPWYNIKDSKIIHHESFEELYRQVVINSADIINKLYDYIFLDKELDVYKLIGNYSLANGLVLKD